MGPPVSRLGRPEEELMTQAPVRQEVFRLGDGDVIITFPANISRMCIEDLKAQFDLFIEKLRWPNEADRQAFLRGLAESPDRKGLSGRGCRDSKGLSKPALEPRCGPRPPGGSIAARGLSRSACLLVHRV